MDILHIKALKVPAKIGVHAWEQAIRQPLLIDISIPGDFSAYQDQLAKALDYDTLCQTATEFVLSKSFQLIESVAHELATLLQQRFQIHQLTVAVSKPHAIKNAGLIQVVVNR